VLTDPTLGRRLLGELIGYTVAHSEPPDSITMRVARTGKAARIEVVSEGGHATGHDLPDLTSAAEELKAMGGEIGRDGPVGAVVSWMRLPLSPGRLERCRRLTPVKPTRVLSAVLGRRNRRWALGISSSERSPLAALEGQSEPRLLLRYLARAAGCESSTS
jgi:hypothetical protein